MKYNQEIYELINEIQKETLSDPALANSPKFIELLYGERITKTISDSLWKAFADHCKD